MCETPVIIAGEAPGINSLYDGMKDYFKNLGVLTSDRRVLSLKKSHYFLDDLESQERQLVVMSGFRPLLSSDQLAMHTFLNIHYGALPRYRGMHPVVWSLLNDEREFGWTLHLVDEFMDSGPILYQYRLANDREITAPEVMTHFHKSVTERIAGIIFLYLQGLLPSVPQNEKAAIWCGKRNLADCYLNFSEDSEELKRIFRALCSPYPYPRIEYKKISYEIREFEIKPDNQLNLTTGRIYNVDKRGAWIRFSDCYLHVRTFWDLEGREISASDIFPIGARLEKFRGQ